MDAKLSPHPTSGIVRKLLIGYGKARSPSRPTGVLIVRHAPRVVELREYLAVLVVDDRALDLQGRRKSAVGLGESVAEDREPRDLLDPRELPSDPVDVLLDLRVDLVDRRRCDRGR